MLAEKYVIALLCPYLIFLALLKATARMPESILFYKKDKTIPSHHDNPFRSFKCASYALKWMDKVNDHYHGQPSHSQTTCE